MIYLASSSPRRAELLEQIGVKFNVLKLDIDESIRENEQVDQLVLRLSREKAIKGRELLTSMTDNDLVLAADTLIHIEGEILGKPTSNEHCCKILKTLSGKTHQVLTAIAVIDSQGELSQQCSISDITFRDLENREIEYYCQSKEPFDKAGAYAIQGKAAVFIEHISGSYSSVMGLPLCETDLLLKRAGYNNN